MKNNIYKILKKTGLFNFLKQLKIDYMSAFKRDVSIDFIDLSHLSYKEAGYELARLYNDDILSDMPIDYSEEVVKSYELLSQLDENIVEELDAISEYLQIDKYLLLAKDLLFVPEACTSVSIKDKHNTYIGQNLDLGYDGSNLLVKKYRDYITVSLKNHPLWSTVGINKYDISFSGSSVNSKHYGEGVMPSVLNSKFILSKCKNIEDVINFYDKNKFYVGNDAGSYVVTDKSNIFYMECDSKDFFYSEKKIISFTTNKFIENNDTNLFNCSDIKNDAIQREKYFINLKVKEISLSKIHEILSSHDAKVCAHSVKTSRYTTCTIIIDKKNKKFYFSKQLPCRIKSISDYFQVDLDFL